MSRVKTEHFYAAIDTPLDGPIGDEQAAA